MLVCRPPPAHTPDAARLKSPPPAPPPLPLHLVNLTDSLLRRIDDLETVQIPQLAGCKGPLSFHDELAAGVRGELAGCKRDLEELKLEVDDLEKARDRLAAAEHVKAVQQRLDSCTRLYRQAVVTSKRQIDAFSHLSARDELLSTHSGQGQGGGGADSPYGSVRGGISRARSPAAGQTSDDALMSATSDVTEGLRRTLQLMQSEVDRSLVSNELLQSQTQTMQLTTDEYSTLSSLMSTSKNLITSLERADVLDRLVLFFAFSFFAAVCAHIFKKRVIDKGVRVAGALGSIAARGGSLVGAAGGVGKHVEQAREIGHHGAREVVRSEIADEVAKAAATATAVVGAIRAGVTSVVGRARDEGVVERAPAAAPFEDVLPEEGAEGRHAAPVERGEPAAAEEEEDEVEDEGETFQDAPDSPLFDDDADLPPIPAEPLDSLSDLPPPASSSAAPLPASSTSISASASPASSPFSSPSSPSSTPPFPSEAAAPPPAASYLPVEDAPAPAEGHGLFQPGDADLHRVVPPPLPTDAEPVEEAHSVMPPVAGEGLPRELEVKEREVAEPAEEAEGLASDAGRVELRQPHAPAAPSPTTAELPVFEELAEETPAVLPDEKPDLREVVEHEEEEAEEEEEEEAPVEQDEKVFEPLKSLRPSRPDLDEQLGDIEAIVEENRVLPPPPPSHSPSAAEDDEPVDLPSPPTDFSATADESLPESTTMPTPPSPDDSPDSLEDEEDEETPAAVPIAVDDPTLLDSYASTPPGIVDAAAEAEEAREVAGPEGTTVPVSVSVEKGEDAKGAVPAVDVEEEGEVPAAAALEGDAGEAALEAELPIDLDAEQSLWPDAAAASAEGESLRHSGTAEEQEALDLDASAGEAVVGEQEEGLPPAPAHEGEEGEGEQERRMLEEMLERQFGGLQGHGPVVGGFAPNATEPEPAPAPIKEQEQEAERSLEAEEEQQEEPVEEALAVGPEEEEEEETRAEPAAVEEQEAPEPLAEEEIPIAAEQVDDEEEEQPSSVPAEASSSPSPSSTLEPEPSPLTSDEPLHTPVIIETIAPLPPPAAEAEAEPSPSAAYFSTPTGPTPVQTAFQHETTPEPVEPEPFVTEEEEEEAPHATSSTASLEMETAAPPPIPTDATEVVEEEDFDDVADAIAGEAAPFVGEVVTEEEEPPVVAIPVTDEAEAVAAEAPSVAEPTPSFVPAPVDEDVEEPAEVRPVDEDEVLLASTDADIPNSDALYPDASVEETPSDLEADFPSHSLSAHDGGSDDAEDGDEGVFASAAEEAVAAHVGEDDEPPVPGHAAGVALQRAEERLHELEAEGEEEEEFELEEEGDDEALEEAEEERVQRDEL
ncbi:hypothetical protein JCM6882_002316 [Rhodosporidiobolus microsporus]